MSRIIFSLFNHTHASMASMADILPPYINAFRDLGHEVGLSQDKIMEDCLNIVTEHFPDDVTDLLLSRPLRFGILQTELMTGNTFNNDAFFRKRYRNFMRLAEKAEFVINIVGESRVPCRHFRCEPGWHPALDAEADNDHLIDTDIYFFGSMSHRRQEILHQLSNAGLSVLVSKGDTGTEERDRCIQKSRFVLGLKCHWPVEFASLTRIAASLRQRRPVIYENVAAGNGMDLIPCVHEDDGDFTDYVVQLCRDREWESIRRQQRVMFETLSVTRNLSIGLIEQGIVI